MIRGKKLLLSIFSPAEIGRRKKRLNRLIRKQRVPAALLPVEVQGDVALVNGNLDLAAKYYEQAAGISGQDP